MSTICGATERSDHHCGDDLVGSGTSVLKPSKYVYHFFRSCSNLCIRFCARCYTFHVYMISVVTATSMCMVGVLHWFRWGGGGSWPRNPCNPKVEEEKIRVLKHFLPGKLHLFFFKDLYGSGFSGGRAELCGPRPSQVYLTFFTLGQICIRFCASCVGVIDSTASSENGHTQQLDTATVVSKQYGGNG